MNNKKLSYGQYLLQQYLGIIFSDKNFLVNYRPEWLNGLELDFYNNELKLGFEFNGDHHYRITDYSYNIDGVRHRDKTKKQLCKDLNIKLIVIDPVNLNFNVICNLIKLSKTKKAKILSNKNYYNEIARLKKESKCYLFSLQKKYKMSINVHKKDSKKRKQFIKKNKKRDKLIQSIKSGRKLENRIMFS